MRSGLLAPLALLVAWGCSGGEGDDAPGAGGAVGDGRAFVPEGLPNTELDGQEGGLTLVGFTIERHERSLEAYLAVKNENTAPACSVGVMIECYDHASALITSAGGSVESGHFYVIDDGSGVVLSCIPPGQVGMAAVTGFPPELMLEQIGSLKHNFPAFELAVRPLEGVGVGKLQAVTAGGMSTYAGTYTNGLAVAVSSPTVSVFPVNRVGRPLGVGTATAVTDVAPAGTWAFETTGVADPGVGYVAFPGGSIAMAP